MDGPIPGRTIHHAMGVLTAILLGCQQGPPPGRWTGTFTRPGQPAAFAFFLDVGSSAPDRTVDFLGATVGAIPLEVDRFGTDTIALALPAGLGGATCRTGWDDAGWFIGECRSGGAHAGTLSLAPPGSAAPLPNGLVARALARVPWDTRVTAPFHVHYSPSATRSDSAERAALQLPDIRADARRRFDFPPDERPIHVFIAGTAEELAAATGVGGMAYADPAGRAVFVAINDRDAGPHRHELMHVLSVGAWGWPRPPSVWLTEGLAVWFDALDSLGRFRTCIGTVEGLTTHLIRTDSLLPMPAVIDDLRANNDRQRGVVQSAAFLGYIHDEWGHDAVRLLWSGGTDALRRRTGQTLDRMLVGWMSSLREAGHRGPAPNWYDAMLSGCSR